MDNWIEAAAEAARDEFRKTGRALLLTALPGRLQERGIDLKRVLQGRKLKQVLQAEAENRLRLMQSPYDPLTWGIAQSDGELELRDVFQPPRGLEASRPPSYMPGFWSAFVKPLESGKRRYLCLDPKPVHFIDTEATFSPPTGLIEVEYGDIIPPNTSPKLPAVQDKAGRWCQRHQLSLSNFESRSTKDEKTNVSWAHQLISLSDADLSRISVPLDIVKRILDART